MKKLIKKHFIPHEENGHRPAFLAGPNVRKILFLVLALELVVLVLPSVMFHRGFDAITAVLPSVLNVLTNEERASAELVELKENDLLTQAAQMKADDMARKGYFAHTSPEGITPWYWLGEAGYEYALAGENLAVNFVDSEEVTEAWMNSPTHRDNILKQGFVDIGTAVARGEYEGRRAIFVVQYYGLKLSAISRPIVAVPSDLRVQSQPASVVETESPVGSAEVLGEETLPEAMEEPVELESEPIPLPHVSFIEERVTSPRGTTNMAFLVILALVVVAVIGNSAMRVHKSHPDLATNGLALAALVLGVYLANNLLLASPPILTSDMAFSSVIESE